MGKEIISYDVMNYVWSGLNENGTKISEGSYYIILQATTENGDNYSRSEIISLYELSDIPPFNIISEKSASKENSFGST